MPDAMSGFVPINNELFRAGRNERLRAGRNERLRAGRKRGFVPLNNELFHSERNERLRAGRKEHEDRLTALGPVTALRLYRLLLRYRRDGSFLKQ